MAPFLWFTQLSSVGWRKETYKYQTWNQFRYCFICKCYIFIKSERFQHALQATVSPKLTEPSFARFFRKTGQACRAFNLTTNKCRRSAGEVASSGYQKVPFWQSTKGVSPWHKHSSKSISSNRRHRTNRSITAGIRISPCRCNFALWKENKKQ